MKIKRLQLENKEKILKFDFFRHYDYERKNLN